MKFSIVVVALNPGEKLKLTIDSILRQTCTDYEIVVKDGGSKDGSVQALPKEDRIQLYVEKDTGIYDAMNQAVAKAKGEYILFLNCGDSFYDDRVLERAAECIAREKGKEPLVVYGDTYGAKNDVMLTAPGQIDGFACYRNIPCHQSCFYEASLCKEKPYNPEYRIRADYEHFLWCYYQAKAKMVHMGSVVASYEGGGYSESKENRKRDKEEHRLITEAYMEPSELSKYRRIMALTLAPLRSFLAENKFTAGIYHWLKDCVCHHKLRMLLGLIVFAVELYLFLGTGVLHEDVVSFHSGAGSWEEILDEQRPAVTQEFKPQYGHLESLSFLAHKGHVAGEGGGVKVIVASGDGTIVYEQELALETVKDGRFTDVEVDLELSTRKKYYLTLVAMPSETGEYPTVGVCNLDIKLPENKALTCGEERTDVQLVSRYSYTEAVLGSKVRNVLLICLVTAWGIMFGLPANKKVRRVAGIALMIVVPLVLGQRLELLTYNEMFYLPFAMKWNLAIMYALEILVLLVTHSPAVSVVLTNVALTILYSVNYFMILYRGTSLRLNDLTAIGTATDVMDEYSFVPNSHMAIAWGLLGMFVVFALWTVVWGVAHRTSGGESEKSGRGKGLVKKAISYAVTTLLAVAIALYGGHKLMFTDYLDEVGFADKEFSGFSYELIYSFNGFLVGSCVEIKNSRIVEPQGYSVAQVEAILTDYAQESAAEEDMPHVILIMNESLSDVQAVADVELSEDCMPFLHSMEENTVKGSVNASTLGGGTANSEFEALTGCSMAFLPTNYYPYQQAVRQPLDSMVSQLEKYGYTTIAMHPESEKNWNRKTVYKNFGFDRVLFEDEFAGMERVHYGISDRATYEKVIELYENREAGEKLFLFDLTVQNHGGYNASKEPDAVRALNVNDPQLDEFLSIVKISDDAFADLVEYFEKQEEKVVICMFGDHQPWIFDPVVEEHPLEGVSVMENNMNKYRTPFVIWANYDIEEASGCDYSINYLGGLVMKTAGIPLSPYFAYLEKLREEYPVITQNGYVDSDGVCHEWSRENTEFLPYRMLQYNYLFDRETVEWGFGENPSERNTK